MLICAAISVAALLCGGREARAQFIVQDPTNLVQSILQYLQDQMREGGMGVSDAVEGASKLQIMREQLKNARDRLDQVYDIVNKFQNLSAAASDIKSIVQISQLITDDILTLKDIEYYMNNIGGYNAATRVGNLCNSYQRITQTLTDEIKNDMRDLSRITQTDPLTMLSQLRERVEYLYSSYGRVRSVYFGAVRQAYLDDINDTMRDADDVFLASLFY